MKLKYYIRGLGIGIIITTILMGLNQSGQSEKISNQEIINRAKEMGMYESVVVGGTISDNETEKNISENKVEDTISDNIVEDTISENIVENTISDNEVETTTEDEELVEPSNDIEDSASVSEEDVDASIEPEEVVIIINSGEGSLSVCKKLVQAGLVEDAATYDAYLAKNGYDKRIKTGNHVMTMGMSQEEIAKIISSNE